MSESYAATAWAMLNKAGPSGYNGLQIRQSNRQVYGPDGDFELAEETIERLLNLKDPHRERFKRLG